MRKQKNIFNPLILFTCGNSQNFRISIIKITVKVQSRIEVKKRDGPLAEKKVKLIFGTDDYVVESMILCYRIKY